MSRWTLTIEERLSEGLMECNGPLDTPCWYWTKSTTHGYGYIWYIDRNWATHRLSWFLHNGEIPTGLLVLHKCDVRPCCNPEHLFLGTYQDNNDDMEAKNRHDYARKGEVNPRAILKPEDVLLIRELCDNGTCHTDIAHAYGVKPSAIDKIAARRTWRHL